MRLSLIRHGKAQYKEVAPTRDRENAKDIVPESLDSLREQARYFVANMRAEDSVTIWSSPIPRSLETSRIFEAELIANGKDIRKTSVFNVFEEARGFRWEYLTTLVYGGEILINGAKVVVDAHLTNPDSISISEYFRASGWKDIAPQILENLGPFSAVIAEMEDYGKIVDRIAHSIERLRKLHDRSHHLLIFTHQCCTDFVIEAVNDYEKGGINPGESVTLEIRESSICVIETPFGSGGVDDIITSIKERQGLLFLEKNK